jgi:hypothetical protein
MNSGNYPLNLYPEASDVALQEFHPSRRILVDIIAANCENMPSLDFSF